MEGDNLDDAANGIAVNSKRTDNVLVVDRNAVNGGFAFRKSNGFLIQISGGGIISLYVDIYFAAVAAGFYINVIAVKTGRRVKGGRCRPDCCNFLVDLGVFDGIQHINSIKKLILLHIGLAQCNIQLHSASVGDGLGQSVLRFGVVSVGLIMLSKLNSDFVAASGLIVSEVIEPCGNFVVTTVIKGTGGA